MDGLTLVLKAEKVGLVVASEGDRLTIFGPQRAEAVALELLQHKPAVMEVLHIYTPHERRLLSDCSPRTHEIVGFAKRIFAPVEVIDVSQE